MLSVNVAPRPEGVNVAFKELVYKILSALRMSYISDGWGRSGTLLEGIKAIIACIIGRRAILSCLCAKQSSRATCEGRAFERVCCRTRRWKCR